MQALEWGFVRPDLARAVVSIGSSLCHSAQGIAYNLLGREAIMLDSAWQGGDYYASGLSPDRGLALARMAGMITYQSAESMRRKFDRRRVDATPENYYNPASRFQVENYLYYQGGSLARRFDANSYLTLTRAMDLHDVGYGRGGVGAALARTDPGLRALVVGIDLDILFQTDLQHEIVAAMEAAGRAATYRESFTLGSRRVPDRVRAVERDDPRFLRGGDRS